MKRTNLSPLARFTATKVVKPLPQAEADSPSTPLIKLASLQGAAGALNPATPPLKRRKRRKQPKRMLALLISAHNEELVIEQTVRSAIRAGMKPKDVYIVDDNSGDATSRLAKRLVGERNVLTVERSGKGLALTKAAAHFNLVSRYRWIHIADADGAFAPDYFRVFRGGLRVKYAAATGYVRSLPGNTVSQYRVFEYTVGMEVHRRFQTMAHTVPVIPGPTSCFRSDVFAKVNFANHTMTEDFDVTLQIHRKKLGKVQFIPRAITYTQDPQNHRDFSKQVLRWNRGMMQSVLHHRIGLRLQRIDLYLSYQILQNLLFFLNYFVIIPVAALAKHSINVAAAAFLLDITLFFGMTLIVAMRAGRWDILSVFPHLYVYRMVPLLLFLRSFVEIMILRKFKVDHQDTSVWGTEGRRYKQAVTLS